MKQKLSYLSVSEWNCLLPNSTIGKIHVIFSTVTEPLEKFKSAFQENDAWKLLMKRHFLERHPAGAVPTGLFCVLSLQLEVWHARNAPRVYIGWIMMPLTLPTRLERPGRTSGPLYHYLRLFTVKCLVWTGCGVECSSPQRTRFPHILRLCTDVFSADVMWSL